MACTDGHQSEACAHTEVRIVEDQNRQHEVVDRGNVPEDVGDALVQQRVRPELLPPSGAAYLSGEVHLSRLLVRQVVAQGPQVDARVKHIHRNEGKDDATGSARLVLIRGGVGCEEVDPADTRGNDDHGRPILHDHDRNLCEVAASPTADVLAVHEVVQEVPGAGEHGETLDGPDHEEELVGAPDVVHGQEGDLVRIHAFHDGEAHAVRDDERIVQERRRNHEAHHADIVEVELGRAHGQVDVEADPKKRGPEPNPVGEVVKRDDQASPPLHLPREQATTFADFANVREHPQQKEDEYAGPHEHNELQGHVLVHPVGVRVRRVPSPNLHQHIVNPVDRDMQRRADH
mmetsp:Transcript_48970/g.158199  ORF Transcript_48970/g.158199 Transcript_48970/m.158199 type:complete len:346 (+) Transcript_48970:172-1209(+)